MANDGLKLSRITFAGIAEVYFMMMPGLADVHYVPLGACIFMHQLDRSRLILIRSYVQALDTQALVIGHVLDFGEILFLLPGSLSDSPGKVLLLTKSGGGWQIH